MENNFRKNNNLIEYIKVYEFEPLGKMINFLNLSATQAFFVFIIFYFSLSLLFNLIDDKKIPLNIRQLINLPPDYTIYPNLGGIISDLIIHPLLFYFLFFFRNFIPSKILELEKYSLIEEKKTNDFSLKILRNFTQKSFFNKITIFIIFFSIFCTVLYSYAFVELKPENFSLKYATFLASLGYYVQFAIILQIIYLLLIMYNYNTTIRINIFHPNGCFGFELFGNIAISIYSFLFIFAMKHSLESSLGGGTIEQLINKNNIFQKLFYFILIHFWLIFPIFIIYIYIYLIYKPHLSMINEKNYYIEKYIKNIKILKSFYSEKPYITETINCKEIIDEIDKWEKIKQKIVDIPNWPISKNKINLIATIFNPLIPILLPFITFLIDKLLSDSAILKNTHSLVDTILVVN